MGYFTSSAIKFYGISEYNNPLSLDIVSKSAPSTLAWRASGRGVEIPCASKSDGESVLSTKQVSFSTSGEASASRMKDITTNYFKSFLGKRNGQFWPFLTEISQSLSILLNPLQRQRVQERKLSSSSTAGWMEVQPKSTSFRTASSKNAVSADKPSFFKKIKKVLHTQRQSNEEYVEHLAEETLSRILKLGPKLGRAPTVFDIYNHFAKEVLTPEVWNAVLTFYPNIRSFSEGGELEVMAV